MVLSLQSGKLDCPFAWCAICCSALRTSTSSGGALPPHHFSAHHHSSHRLLNCSLPPDLTSLSFSKTCLQMHCEVIPFLPSCADIYLIFWYAGGELPALHAIWYTWRLHGRIRGLLQLHRYVCLTSVDLQLHRYVCHTSVGCLQRCASCPWQVQHERTVTAASVAVLTFSSMCACMRVGFHCSFLYLPCMCVCWL